MEVGDLNMKLFQRYANYCKSFNAIWELKDADGSKVCGFSNLTSLWIQHFHSLFQESPHFNMDFALKLLSYFPQLVGEE